MATLMKPTDARVRILNQKIEYIANNIALEYDSIDIEKTDILINQLYSKTRAIRSIHGVDRLAYACVKGFLDTFCLKEFATLCRV